MNLVSLSKKENTLDSRVFSRNYFSIPTTIKGSPSPSEGLLRVLTSKGDLFVKKEDIGDSAHILNKYKVITTYAMSGGNKPSGDGKYQILSSLQILKPGEACSETYLILDCFDDYQEAQQMLNYMNGKFSRYLLLQALTSIHITKDKFCFVPIQPAQQPVNDAELYRKYGLNSTEISLIEGTIK